MIFQTFFIQPIFNLLVFLYNTISFQDLGIAIILLTVILKTILLPLSKKSIKIQKQMQEIQPEIEEIKKKYKDNKEEQGKALMSLYKEKKVNPFSSCFPLLIQLPFLIAVFRIFRNNPNESLDLVYPFLVNFKPESINMISLGFLNLSEPNIIIALLAGGAQFWQTKTMMARKKSKKIDEKGKEEDKKEEKPKKEEGMMVIMNKQMLYFMPIMTIAVGSYLPAGLTLYWLVVTLFTALQQLYVYKKTEKLKSLKSSN